MSGHTSWSQIKHKRASSLVGTRVASNGHTDPPEEGELDMVWVSLAPAPDLSVMCYQCGAEMIIQIHGHYQCKCGWRDSCCQ